MKFMGEERVGEIHATDYGKCEIIDYASRTEVTIKFRRTGGQNIVSYNNLVSGKVKDPLAKIVCGVGCLGEGPYDSTTHRNLYYIWNKILRRVYIKSEWIKHPTYKNCRVTNRWINFQLFCGDVLKMKNCGRKGFELDKDLRVIGNKVYGRKFCSFVPKHVNALLNPKQRRFRKYSTHVMDKRIANIRKVAKDNKHLIHPDIYTNLMSIDHKYFLNRTQTGK